MAYEIRFGFARLSGSGARPVHHPWAVRLVGFFVLLWYGLLGAGTFLGAPATAIAFLNRRLPARLRVAIAAMALPSLLGVPIAVWMIENAAGTLPY